MFIPTEILQEISSYFAEDKSTLFSCILVSRHWCNSLIEILWSQPFHLSHSSRIIETYLLFLPLNSKKNERKPIFDYPSFLKKLSIPLLCNSIGEYLRKELGITTLPSSKVNFCSVRNIEQIMYTDLLKLFSKQKQIQFTPTFKLLLEKQIIILQELCKLIYDKINAIHELEFNIGVSDLLNQQLAFEELIKLQDCFRGLKVLNYSGSSHLLCFFAKHCKRIESLKLLQITYSKFKRKFNFEHVEDYYDEDPSIQLISTQKALRDLEIHNWNALSLGIMPPTVSNILQSIQTQSDSLRIIRLINCDFYKSKPLSPLSKCRNLEEITIKENYNFDERLLIPLTKVKFYNLKKFIYKFQLNSFFNDQDFSKYGDDEDESEFIEMDIDLDEIFSCIVLNSRDSLQTVAINGFKTTQSIRNTLNSLTECRNLIKLDIMLEKSENTLSSLLSVVKYNQLLEKLYIISDSNNPLNRNNRNSSIDVNQFLQLFVKLLPRKFKFLCMNTPDWWFNTKTLDVFLEQAKFRLKSMCWMNYGCNLECSEVLRKYAMLHSCELLFGEDCEFINDNLGPFRMNVYFDFNDE